MTYHDGEGPITPEEAKEQVAAEEPNDDTEPPAEPVEDPLENGPGDGPVANEEGDPE